MKPTWLLIMFLLAGTVTGFGEDAGNTPKQPIERKRWIYRGEVFGSIGWGGFWHGDDSLGSGIELGGGVGSRPFQGKLRGLGFEVQVKQLHHDIQHSATHSTNGKALTLIGNVLYHFSDSTVQPYVLGGIGVLKADYVPSWEYHEGYWRLRVNASKMAINLGVGLKAAIRNNFSIRPELTLIDTTPGSGYNWASLRLSIGVGYHW